MTTAHNLEGGGGGSDAFSSGLVLNSLVDYNELPCIVPSNQFFGT